MLYESRNACEWSFVENCNVMLCFFVALQTSALEMDLYGATKSKYDVPLNHLDFAYVKSCQNKKELEHILKILRCVMLTILLALICTEHFVILF